MTSDAQKRAVKNYKERNKGKIKRLTIDFSPNETELYEHISKQVTKQGYIKDLIRADMQKAE